jgi:hypothetical protein
MTKFFQGPVKSDTHQQDCEMARIELEVHGDSVEGRFATLFCLQGGEPYLTADGYQPFTGRVIERIPPDGFIAELHGRFRCHYFDCADILFEVRGAAALIYENKKDRAVTLYEKKEE